MVEPEMAFCDLEGNMNLAEEIIKYVISYAIDQCGEDLELFEKFVDKGLMSTLDGVASSDFVRLPYTDAVELLKIRLPYTDAVELLKNSGKKFEYDVGFGKDLQVEHERYLTEHHFKKPVIIYNYPKTIKPFYMRLNSDNKTVAAMDVLVPKVGELIGGSQREERYDILESRMDEMKMPKEAYWWYLDSRRYGTVEHSGFGLGFDRFIMFVTGVKNIRDVIPFPRTPNKIEF